jgi:hypothetical protein
VTCAAAVLKRIAAYRWRHHLEGVNFSYALFAVALIWLCGVAYLGD